MEKRPTSRILYIIFSSLLLRFASKHTHTHTHCLDFMTFLVRFYSLKSSPISCVRVCERYIAGNISKREQQGRKEGTSNDDDDDDEEKRK